ncbi:USP / UDP-sugar pyrophosphorylase [Leishmania donovani]|uniref:UTP-monosaccharide-1-phosphate uridylyltransferase n=1 Tax=Leishmania donovani TaxID=5661 RepID=A0A3S7WUL7_LEIDO|nr:UDP-sugar pyrophosphorylase [Leishmania donovani]TPP55054.1 UTP--glucose-1-phosphate uridylyltransferase family protein [Leishmania donovani]CAJ1987909.1 USP / UDP-sugar pyrophosphorylase [Leishmania donovani]VDZ43796.1 UDP-sugar_pyrophosphorylase/GeneDB:LmjF.17.1160 [Leishmania donovani]
MTNPSNSNLQALREELCTPGLDQGHLFEGWPETVDECDERQIALLTDLYMFSNMYPGGVAQYIRNGHELLARESEEVDFAALEMPPLIFEAPSLHRRTAERTALESAGTAMLCKTVFVLVAGGLGERLGYSSIKVGLPVETATNTTYLAYYLRWAQRVGGKEVPFVIMTSDDTHDRTLQLLRELQLDVPNLHVLKQGQVFCFADSAAHLALDDTGKLLRKPHGHGDVHSLIYNATVKRDVVPNSGDGTATAQPLVNDWLAAGYESIVFIQDTNAGATVTIPISLALSAEHSLDMNFTCIPRVPKEPIGLLCRAKKNSGDPWLVASVEYNVFAEVSRTLNKDGGEEASDPTGFSPFPGSVNTLVLKLSSYVDRLRESNGIVPEFINPKYSDETRRSFKKPARIESLMQDIALLFSEDDYRVGGTVFERFSYQPVKNSLKGAAALVAQGNGAYCAATGEADFYELQRRRLKAIGLPLFYSSQAEVTVANDTIGVHIFPIIVLDAMCASSGSLDDLASVFPTPEKVHIDQHSTLIVEGRVIIESLELYGALTIRGPTGPMALPHVIRNAVVRNAGWSVHAILSLGAGCDSRLSEVDRIRGFVLEKTTMTVMDCRTKGESEAGAPSGAADPAKL